jgi:alpha-galactosidase
MLSAFSLLSTSDQINYTLYPYIAGNILSAVLPEQAAVWSYPKKEPTAQAGVTEKSRVTVNMINSFLGRMHLASNVGELSEEGQALVKEGVDYYNSLSEMKTRALPYFPNGFTFFDEPSVVSGLKDGNRLYLAVWCLSDDLTVRANVKNAKNVRIAYPTSSDAKINVLPEGIDVTFPEKYCAAFLEMDL